MNTLTIIAATFVVSISLLMPCPASAADSEPVTVDNFVRAETDHMLRATMKAFGVKIGVIKYK